MVAEERSFLQQLERELAAVLPTPPESCLHAAARHLCLGGRAKRARPRLVLRMGELAGARPDHLLDVAVAAELLHSASLLHDDVVDAGEARRGRPTANAVYGNPVAVLAGDLLITVALHRLRELPRAITSDGVETVALMTRAALRELEVRGQVGTTLDTWRTIARGKTGALLGFCARAAGLLVDEPDLAKRLGAAAERFGVAFQMADDVADYVSGTGKALHKDLQEKAPGLPLLLACRRDPRLARDVTAAWGTAADRLDPESAGRLGARVLASGAVDEARTLLRVELSAAIEALGELASRIEGEEVLAWAAEIAGPGFFVTERRSA